MRFNHLKVPDQWQNYWSKYPNGYTILEALLNWVHQVDGLINNVNDWNKYLEEFVENFDKKLQPTIEKFLNEMLADGRLQDIIDESLFDLNSRGVNIKHPPFPLVGVKMDNVTDDSEALQALIDHYTEIGGTVLIVPEGKMLLNHTVYPKSNVHIKGIGWSSIIRTAMGSPSLGMNIFQIVEQENIVISNLKMEGTGFGKSGEWIPVGSLEGAGSAIVAANSNNIVVAGTWLYNFGGYAGGNGVGNVWFSCCRNSRIVNNTLEKGDNAVCIDRWYSNFYADGINRADIFNDGVIASNNNIFDMTGRAFALENVNDRGSLIITNNTIMSVLYAGIDGRNLTNTIISGNTFEGMNDWQSNGDKTARMIRGIYILNGTNRVIISNNNFQNISAVGMQLFNTYDFNIYGNSFRNIETGYGISIKNQETDMLLGSVANNVMNNVNEGIYIYKDDGDTSVLSDVSVANNVIRFITSGIYLQRASNFNVHGNIVVPITSFGGSIGIRLGNTSRFNVTGNQVRNCTQGYALGADFHSYIDGGVVENCANAFVLTACENTKIKGKIRGGTTAFNVSGMTTSQSRKCHADVEITDTTNVKNGNGVIVKYRGGQPTHTTCDIGDMVESSSPLATGYMGWVCIEMNSANWHGYGKIEEITA